MCNSMYVNKFLPELIINYDRGISKCGWNHTNRRLKNFWLHDQGEKRALAERKGAVPPDASPYCQPCWSALRGACV